MRHGVGMIHHAVVIAGGGPTGLMLAAELAIARVDVAIVERRLDQSVAGSRAGGLHARTIEVLDQRGVVDRFLSAGKTGQFAGYAMITLDLGDFPSRHNYVLALKQEKIEQLLAAWVEELRVPIYRGREVAGFAQDEHGVDVRTSDDTVIRAQYLVACDGGRSAIRKQAGIELAGWDPSVSYLIAEATLTAPTLGMRRGAKGVIGIGPMEGSTQHRIVMAEPEIRQGDEPTVAELSAALIAAYGSDFEVRDVTWISRFTDATRQATAYRKDRVLIAGDAAHVHSPTGGQGLNLGVQDAVNLGWKLAQVVRGTSAPALLDSYQAERHPVAARALRTTMAQTALMRGDDRTLVLHEMMKELLALDEPRRRYGGMMSGLDIRYDLGAGHLLLGHRVPDLEILTGDGKRRVYALLHEAMPVLLDLGASLEITGWGDRVKHVVARYDGSWELPVIGPVSAAHAMLIRPDGYVAWVGTGMNDGLRDALATWFGPAT